MKKAAPFVALAKKGKRLCPPTPRLVPPLLLRSLTTEKELKLNSSPSATNYTVGVTRTKEKRRR